MSNSRSWFVARTRAAARRGAARALLLALLGLGLLAGGGWWWFGRPEPTPEVRAEADPARAPMTEAERLAYVKAHVKLEDFAVEPDREPDTDEPVPGLLRITGRVTNTGARELGKAVVAVYPRDDSGEVVAAHLHDAVKDGGPLDPGQSRSFSFTIPDRQAIGFDQELR